MTILREARWLDRLAQEIVLTNATKVPAEKLMISITLDAGLERVLDCWEVDQELAYEQSAVYSGSARRAISGEPDSESLLGWDASPHAGAKTRRNAIQP